MVLEYTGRRFLQFNESGFYICDPSDIRYTPNASGEEGLQGFGIFQLTFFGSPGRVPNAQELWSWKTNVDTATDLLTSLQQASFSYMLAERNQALADSGFQFFWPPVEYVANVVFQDQTAKVIDHAVAMKRYNGVGGGGNRQYCEWRHDEGRWAFNRLNNCDPPFNYVERVCSNYR